MPRGQVAQREGVALQPHQFRQVRPGVVAERPLLHQLDLAVQLVAERLVVGEQLVQHGGEQEGRVGREQVLGLWPARGSTRSRKGSGCLWALTRKLAIRN